MTFLDQLHEIGVELIVFIVAVALIIGGISLVQ